MAVVIVSLLAVVVLALMVLVAVAFPYRGRPTTHAPWLGRYLGSLLRRFRPSEPHPDYPILVRNRT